MSIFIGHGSSPHVIINSQIAVNSSTADTSSSYFRSYKCGSDLIRSNLDLAILKADSVDYFEAEGVYFTKDTLEVAIDMYLQGWRYIMPRPKSSEAKWGLADERTTWWNGYWYNVYYSMYSEGIPKKESNVFYYGDNKNNSGSWRNGGSPRFPTKIERLLSFFKYYILDDCVVIP